MPVYNIIFNTPSCIPRCTYHFFFVLASLSFQLGCQIFWPCRPACSSCQSVWGTIIDIKVCVYLCVCNSVFDRMTVYNIIFLIHLHAFLVARIIFFLCSHLCHFNQVDKYFERVVLRVLLASRFWEQ